MKKDFKLLKGTLSLKNTTKTYCSFNEIADIGNRINPLRDYIFISKVNGKYFPNTPERISKYISQLAELSKVYVKRSDNILIIGLAETATLMSIVFADCLSKYCPNMIVIWHTTRYQLHMKPLLTIKEKHSHAKKHHLYGNVEEISKINHLLLVDDEISTGKTLEYLTSTILAEVNIITNIQWVSYLSWIDDKRKRQIKSKYPHIKFEFISLFSGEFKYSKTSSKSSQLPESTVAGSVKHNEGKYQPRQPTLLKNLKNLMFIDDTGNKLTAANLDSNLKYTVIGSSEFTYYPYVFAKELQDNGYDVLFQSIGRSPIEVYGPIIRKESYIDAYYKGEMYLYNRDPERVAIFLFETKQQEKSCKLSAHQEIRGYLSE